MASRDGDDPTRPGRARTQVPSRPAAGRHPGEAGAPVRGPGGEPDELTRLARGGAVNVAGSLVNGLSGFLLVFVVSRLLDAGDAGRLWFLTSVFLLLLGLVELGTPTGLARFLPVALASRRPERAWQVLSAAFLPVAVASCGTAVVLLLAAPWLADALSRAPVDGATVLGLRLLAVLLPVAALYELALAVTRGAGSIRATVTVERLGRAGVQFLAVAGAALAGGGVAALAFAWGIGYVPAALVVAGATTRLVERRMRQARARVRAGASAQRPAAPADAGPDPFPDGVQRAFWAYTWARGVSRIFQVALQRLDIVLITALLSPRDAAVYTAATRLVPLGLLGVQAVQQVVQEPLSRLLGTGDVAAARRVYQAATAWSVALAWPVYLAAAILAPQLLRLFGAGYDDATAVAVVVSAAMLVAVACGPADMALLMAGRSRLSLGNTALALVADIALNLVLLPRVGITGAGIAWACAILLTNLPAVLQVHAGTGIWPAGGTGLRAAGAALLSFGLVGGGTVALARPEGLLGGLACLALPTLAYAGLVWRHRAVLGLVGLRGTRGVGGPGVTPVSAGAGGRLAPDEAAAVVDAADLPGTAHVAHPGPTGPAATACPAVTTGSDETTGVAATADALTPGPRPWGQEAPATRVERPGGSPLTTWRARRTPPDGGGRHIAQRARGRHFRGG